MTFEIVIYFQCCNHIVSSKAPVNKRKDAQKLAQLLLTKIQTKYVEGSEKATEKNTTVSALEQAFASLELKMAN